MAAGLADVPRPWQVPPFCWACSFSGRASACQPCARAHGGRAARQHERRVEGKKRIGPGTVEK